MLQSLQKLQQIGNRFKSLSENIKKDDILPLKRKWEEPSEELEKSVATHQAYFHLALVNFKFLFEYS